MSINSDSTPSKPSLINGSQQMYTHTHTTDKYSHESLLQLIKSRTKLATEQFYEQTYKMHKEQKTMRETTQMLIYSVEHNLVGYMV